MAWYNFIQYAAAAKSLQSCPTLCDPIDGSLPGFPVPGILQARTLEWVAISFSNAWKWKVKVKSLSRFRLLATPWTAAYQAPPSMGFSRQEYWSGVPLPSPKLTLKPEKKNTQIKKWFENFGNIYAQSITKPLIMGFNSFVLFSMYLLCWSLQQYICSYLLADLTICYT